MKRIIASLTGIVVMGTLVLAGSSTGHAGKTAIEEGRQATFEGQTFNMADGWGSADTRPEIQACHVTASSADCYRSEREMDAAIGGPTPFAVCASSLRLYDGASKSGAVISLTTRGTGLSLSTYGFDNRTSSYQVGACSSNFYSGILSGLYGGNTSANASANSMLSGWDNTVSSVFIN